MRGVSRNPASGSVPNQPGLSAHEVKSGFVERSSHPFSAKSRMNTDIETVKCGPTRIVRGQEWPTHGGVPVLVRRPDVFRDSGVRTRAHELSFLIHRSKLTQGKKGGVLKQMLGPPQKIFVKGWWEGEPLQLNGCLKMTFLEWDDADRQISTPRSSKMRSRSSSP